MEVCAKKHVNCGNGVRCVRPRVELLLPFTAICDDSTRWTITDRDPRGGWSERKCLLLHACMPTQMRPSARLGTNTVRNLNGVTSRRLSHPGQITYRSNGDLRIIMR